MGCYSQSKLRLAIERRSRPAGIKLHGVGFHPIAVWRLSGLIWLHERNIMLGAVLLVLLTLMLLGALPTWPHSRSWGFYPSGGLGLLLAILLVLLLLGRL